MPRETLTSNPEAKFGISPDIKIAETIIIPPIKEAIPVSVIVPAAFMFHAAEIKKDNPDFNLQNTPRSRYAQQGINFQNLGLQVENLSGSQLTLDGGIQTTALVSNHSNRAIKIKDGSGIFKLYYDTGARLVNGELAAAFQRGDIVIEGEPGDSEENNWNYIRDNRTNSVIGIKMRISDVRKWFAPDQQAEPLEIDDESRSFRAEISKHLVEAPKSSIPRLWIGETKAKMTLNGDVHAIIHPVASNENDRLTLSDIGAHLDSRVLYPGNTNNWPIILEIISSTLDSEAPKFVNIHFVKA